MKNVTRLVVALLVSHAAGVIGSFFTISAIPVWYAGLTKPSWTPPNFLFGPVWLLLYTLMGIALFLVWKRIPEYPKAKGAAILFLVHLFFNALWSIFFFGLQNPVLGLVDIIILLAFILVLISQFRKINRWSAYLLLPYLLWVSYATALNIAIVVLN